MSVHIQHHEAGTQIALSGELTIYTVAEIRAALAEPMDTHAPSGRVDIELSGVTEIDSAGLQLLLILSRHTEKEVRFLQHPASVLQLIRLANLECLLGASNPSSTPNSQASSIVSKDDHHEQ